MMAWRTTQYDFYHILIYIYDEIGIFDYEIIPISFVYLNVFLWPEAMDTGTKKVQAFVMYMELFDRKQNMTK